MSDYGPLNPVILPNSRLWIPAFSALLTTFVKGVVTTPSASYVCLLPCKFAH